MTTAFSVTPIGAVSSPRRDMSDDFWGEVVSTIKLDPAHFDAEALRGLADFSHVEVIYVFHGVKPEGVTTGSAHPRENPQWPRVGIFAQRKKNRPNRLGLTTCRVLKVEGLTLTVAELDAMDGTPVLDLKPCMREFLVDKNAVRQPAWVGELMADYFKPDRPS